MARPGQLAEAIADAFDMELATVRQRARILRDAGFMTHEGGGRGDGSMTTRDATHLLISVAGAARVKHTLNPVMQHGACKWDKGPWISGPHIPPELSGLGSEHTFADAIEALLQASIDGSLSSASKQIESAVEQWSFEDDAITVRVTMSEPNVLAEIALDMRIDDEAGGKRAKTIASAHYRPRMSGTAFDPPIRVFKRPDLSHTHIFTEYSLFRLSCAFR